MIIENHRIWSKYTGMMNKSINHYQHCIKEFENYYVRQFKFILFLNSNKYNHPHTQHNVDLKSHDLNLENILI